MAGLVVCLLVVPGPIDGHRDASTTRWWWSHLPGPRCCHAATPSAQRSHAALLQAHLLPRHPCGPAALRTTREAAGVVLRALSHAVIAWCGRPAPFLAPQGSCGGGPSLCTPRRTCPRPASRSSHTCGRAGSGRVECAGTAGDATRHAPYCEEWRAPFEGLPRC